MGLLDLPAQSSKQKYFVLNQSNEVKIDFEFKAPEQEKEHSESKGSKGMSYMLVSAIFFSLTAWRLKVLYMESDINSYEFTYWQSIVMALLNLGMFKAYDKDHLLVREDMRVTLVLRSAAAFLGVSLFFLAL